MDIQSVTMNSTDAQFLENRKFQIEEIARIFGVPPSMLFELGRATWGNAEQMAASFLQLCLRPWLDRWQDAYATVLLTEDEQDSLYFEFVIDDLQRADAAGRGPRSRAARPISNKPRNQSLTCRLGSVTRSRRVS